MNKYLHQLVELAQYDKHLDSFAPRIEKVEKNLNAKKDEIDAISLEIENIDNEIKELKSQISQTNVQIAEFAAKIKDTSKKSSSVKTEREMKALGLEEELAKEQLEAANEEISRLEKILDSKNELKDEIIGKKQKFHEEFESIQTDLKSEMSVIEKDRNKIYTKKDELVKDMNQKMLTFYEKIRKWARNTAVVPVKKQACYGCFMKINDKTYSSVIKSDDIVTCPHCGRILYKETE